MGIRETKTPLEYTSDSSDIMSYYALQMMPFDPNIKPQSHSRHKCAKMFKFLWKKRNKEKISKKELEDALVQTIEILLQNEQLQKEYNAHVNSYMQKMSGQKNGLTNYPPNYVSSMYQTF